MVKIIKKDGTEESFQFEKIRRAVTKSAERVAIVFEEKEYEAISSCVINLVTDIENRNNSSNKDTLIPIATMHAVVETALEQVNPTVAKSYRDYRNYKKDFVAILDEVYKDAQQILFRGDKENANADSLLVSTKRCLTASSLEKQLYKKFFLSKTELAAVKDGYIYIHDMSARRQTFNCCLFDLATVMRNGFSMGEIEYTEPKTLDTAGDVTGDIILSAAGQQYGGFTIPNIDVTLAPYAEKSFNKRFDKLRLAAIRSLSEVGIDYEQLPDAKKDVLNEQWREEAMIQLKKECESVFQGLEIKLNTVASSRGDYPFVTFTFGNHQGVYEEMISSTILSVRMGGQGRPGYKKPVLFPKLVFLYDEQLHGENQPLEFLFEEALDCSSKTMYPDYLSLTGDGYVADMYKKYKTAISPMGCRAFLSPWWKKGGFYKSDEEDQPVFVGRFNIGVVSLNLPMIYAKAKKEDKDFYECLDEYLDIIRGIHQKTYDYLGQLEAGMDPLAFCEGGFYGGHLKWNDKIKPLLDSATAAFGITALNELQMLYNKKMLHEDHEFALQTLMHINDVVQAYKEQDKRLYAIYGTPAESLCGTQVQQFRKIYGIVEGVSDRDYISNSFHCHVTANISPSEKQDIESAFWDFCNGGKIQFVRYPLDYNKDAMRIYIRRAMKKGLYEGVNLRLSYCNQCGHEQLDMDSCPKCGSTEITKIDRMNGYLGYTSMKDGRAGRFNNAKTVEISERISF